MEPLATARLRLVPLSSAHVDALHSIYCETAVREYLITRPADRADFDSMFDRALEFGASHGMWAVVQKTGPDVIGRVGFFAFGEAARPELAFLLCQRSWGQGLATEASSACLRYAFARRRWNEVVAVVRPSNTAAIRVLGKLRMRRDHTVELGGEPAVVYQMSRADWLA